MVNHAEIRTVKTSQKQSTWTALDRLKQREGFTDLDSPITIKEFIRAIVKLKNNEASNITEIPTDVCKCLDSKNRKQV